MKGWSATVGELRAAIQDVPDDYEVVLDNADVEDCEIATVYVRALMDPALDAPGLLVLGSGQVITSEYHYHPRLDVWLEGERGHWKNCARHGNAYGWTE